VSDDTNRIAPSKLQLARRAYLASGHSEDLLPSPKSDVSDQEQLAEPPAEDNEEGSS
jgi:hypothetical protein